MFYKMFVILKMDKTVLFHMASIKEACGWGKKEQLCFHTGEHVNNKKTLNK